MALLIFCINSNVMLGLPFHAKYLDLVRQMNGYNEVTLPHCACDARKDGHVIAILSTSSFKLQACKEDGTTEARSVFFILCVCINLAYSSSYIITFQELSSLMIYPMT